MIDVKKDEEAKLEQMTENKIFKSVVYMIWSSS